MKRLAIVVSFSAMAAFAGEWKGTISDAKCAVAHADASEKSMNCVKGCVKKGAAPVLVSDGKVYKIADASKVESHLGQKVVVTGSMDGDTVTVESVRADN
jgi:hypothetical protein